MDSSGKILHENDYFASVYLNICDISPVFPLLKNHFVLINFNFNKVNTGKITGKSRTRSGCSSPYLRWAAVAEAERVVDVEVVVLTMSRLEGG